jgi:hypothetical protein
MDNFWIGVAAAQNAAAGTKPPDRRHRVLSIVGGITLAVLIGAGLFIVRFPRLVGTLRSIP